VPSRQPGGLGLLPLPQHRADLVHLQQEGELVVGDVAARQRRLSDAGRAVEEEQRVDVGPT
jgi:hypothetical protein